MANYTYTIFDSNPGASGNCSWPSHENMDIEADSDEEALEDVKDILDVEAHGVSTDDGYEVGQRLYALVWDASNILVGELTHELTTDDLGVADVVMDAR